MKRLLIALLLTLLLSAGLGACSSTSYYQPGQYRNNDTGSLVGVTYDPGYLAEHTNDNFAQPAGDFCTHYGAGGWSNASCQVTSTGAGWTMQVAASDDAFTGIQHRVQLGYDIAGSNRPFANGGTLGLVESVNVSVSRITRGGWHGYLCPTFSDRSTGAKLEYCFELWRGDSSLDGDQVLVGDGGYEMWTNLSAASPFAVSRSGQRMLHGVSTGSFVISVTGQQFRAALVQAASLHSTVVNNISTDPANFSLYQIQAGVEGNGAGSVVTSTITGLRVLSLS